MFEYQDLLTLVNGKGFIVEYGRRYCYNIDTGYRTSVDSIQEDIISITKWFDR